MHYLCIEYCMLKLRDGCDFKDQRMAAFTQLLLIKFTSPNKRVRKIADEFLSELLKRFPFLFWSSPVLNCTLDVLQLLFVTSRHEQSKHAPATPAASGSGPSLSSHSAQQFKMPNALGSFFPVLIASSSQDRERIYLDFKKHSTGMYT